MRLDANTTSLDTLCQCVQVDVGKCSGVCSEEESAEGSGEVERERTPLPLECMATRTTTEAIEGPNGEGHM